MQLLQNEKAFRSEHVKAIVRTNEEGTRGDSEQMECVRNVMKRTDIFLMHSVIMQIVVCVCVSVFCVVYLFMSVVLLFVQRVEYAVHSNFD